MIYKHYQRWQEGIIKQALETRRVILLSGARQCGKTTIAKQLSTEKTIYYTLDDVSLLEAAVSDPHGFVRHADNLMIIDEIQRAPVLLPAIKKEVDENQKYGRFLLTGSANIQSLSSVRESLAGRIRKIRLRPLAYGEIVHTKPHFIKNAFQGIFNSTNNVNDLNQKADDKDEYLLKAFSGGYPEVLRLKTEKDKKQWYKDYINALIDYDLKDIAQIRHKDGLIKLIEVLAAWSSKFIDISAIGSSLSLARPTIESYINALETLYLVERVRPWHKTDYDRVSKQDKLFITDTGLMVSILRWRFEKVRLEGDLNGKLLETFIFNQLSAIIEAQEEDYELYHYRDREKREIDFIIENEEGDLLGIEVKAGSSVNKGSFKHLLWFKDNIAEDHKFTGIVLYTGENILSFGKNIWAVPINAMWG